MIIAGLNLKRLRLPDRAGRLQSAGSIDELIAELGDNYERYHSAVVNEWNRTGRPDPAAFPDIPSYMAALARAEDLAKAEMILRRCAAYRRSGERTDLMRSFGTAPLIDEGGNLCKNPAG